MNYEKKREAREQQESERDRCQLLEVEIKRLNWLIGNMMTNVEDIKEFEYDNN